MNNKKNFLKKRGFLITLAILVLSGGLYIYLKSKNSEEVTFNPVPVKKGNLEVTILATGAVQPENRLDIKAPVPGRMEKVLVDEGQKLHKGQIIAWMSSSERAALLDAARAKGEEELKRWSELYLPTPIMAPITGDLISRNVEPGQTFTSSDAIFTMSDRLTVKAQVDETDISQIKLKQKAQIVLDAYPNQKIMATVDKIAFDAKTISSVTTYIVDVLPDRTPGFMRSGMTANVTFQIESRKDVLLIPNEAIKVQEGRTIVNMQGLDKKPIPQDIQVGISDGKNSEVLEGLQDGDTILIAEKNISHGAKKLTNPFSPMGRAPRH
ncbi:MAG: efflux RND transporter periplasmic adaptor subunit [Pseudobdellovibrionaceae bacterium]